MNPTKPMTQAAHQAGNALTQLTAMLTMTYGNNGEGFRNNADEVQDAYLWACHDLAQKALGLLEQAESESLKEPESERRAHTHGERPQQAAQG